MVVTLQVLGNHCKTCVAGEGRGAIRNVDKGQNRQECKRQDKESHRGAKGLMGRWSGVMGRGRKGRAENEPPVRKLRHNPADRRAKQQCSCSLSSSRPGRVQTLGSGCKEYFPEGVAEDSLVGAEAGGRAPPGGPWRCAQVGAAEKNPGLCSQKDSEAKAGCEWGIFHLDPVPCPTPFHR